MGTEQNPKLWREMQEPHKTVDVANEAADAFYKGVQALREQHMMADVLVVTQMRFLLEDGTEGEGLTMLALGDSQHSESMAAYAYGKCVAQRQETISRLLKGVLKDPKATSK